MIYMREIVCIHTILFVTTTIAEFEITARIVNITRIQHPESNPLRILNPLSVFGIPY